MMIDTVLKFVIPAGYSLLPERMNSKAATAMLLAMGLQESKFLHRRQIVRGGKLGPARGLWQFEEGGGVRGVLEHRSSREPALHALRELRYQTNGRVITSRPVIHAALEHNDVLACCFARLLLFTLPGALPARHQPGIGWSQYLEAWRPGAPHPETWPAYFAEAWDRVEEQESRK